MRKILLLLSLFLVFSCVKDEHEYIDPFVEVPEALQITDVVGIKLQSVIVTDRVNECQITTRWNLQNQNQTWYEQ